MSKLPLILVAASLTGCAVDRFAADDALDSGADGSSGGSEGDEASEGGDPSCDEADRRCAHEFRLADAGYQSVDVIGDFAANGWTVGVPMAVSEGSWRATVDLAWASPTLYKFRIDGGASYIADPDNPDAVDDGFGGQNSVLDAQSCADFTCATPPLIGEFDWRDAVIYFVFVDRFYNGDPSNDGPVGIEPLADWQGGDWAGVRAKIEAGYFDELGVNTLWLTVPADNTDATGVGTDGYDYSAYHGYWPQHLDQPEEHFGTLAELQALVDVAHAHELKVIFDYAMNHVHATSPVYAEHPGWFWPNDNGFGGDCVCGSGCSWNDAEGRRCWFTPYLPDFNFTIPEARQYSIDNAMQWIADTGVDGFRLDAVKHIEDQWLLDLRSRVGAEVEAVTGERFYMVGETFTGDRDLIAYYVDPSMLDGQFDFPLRMEIANKLLMRQGSMSELAGFMDANDDYYGAGIMSTFIGNHDIPRVIHLAEDVPVWGSEWTDGKDLAWANIPLPDNLAPFERVALGFTVILTIPGAPLIYYGDEVGMAGAGDPDNRRFMQWDGYSAGQQLLFDRVATLLSIRAAHPALRRGVRTTLSADVDTLVYAIDDDDSGDSLIVAINRADEVRTAGGLPDGEHEDLLTGAIVVGPSVELGPRASMILAPQ